MKETMFPKNPTQSFTLVQDSTFWTKSGGSPLSEAACGSNSALPFREHLPEPILPRPGVSLPPALARAQALAHAHSRLERHGRSRPAPRDALDRPRARPSSRSLGDEARAPSPRRLAFVTSPRIRAALLGGAVREATRVPRADSGPPPRGLIPRAPPKRRSCAARWRRTPRVAPPGGPPDAAPPAARRPEPGGTRAPRNIRRIPSVRRRRVG